MMLPILKVSPSFEPCWKAFLLEWESDPSGLPLYLALSDLACHLAKRLDAGADEELTKIFAIVEEWHLSGDAYVKEAAIAGLLEDLQNTSLVGPNAPGLFLKYLGPESRRRWKKLEDYWGKVEPRRDH